MTTKIGDPDVASAYDQEHDPRELNGIPVRNLWLLMLYASSLYRELSRGQFRVEENPDDIPDLVAELLTRSVERRLRRNLSRAPVRRSDVLHRVRGRIDVLTTTRHQFLERGVVACRFEDSTINTPRNRYIRAALERLSTLVNRHDLSHRCRVLANSLREVGVIGEKPSRAEMSLDRVERNQSNDRAMLNAAHLAFDLALPTQWAGDRNLPSPSDNVHWLRMLYEKGIAGFYDAVLPDGWRVEAGKWFRWPIEGRTPGIDRILPSMQTDIILTNQSMSTRIVIDTKFTSIVKSGQYRKETLSSGYVYQLYAYLRSQEGQGDPLANASSGLMLHPSTGEMIDETAVIQGHAIRFATVDLAASASKIRDQLINIALQSLAEPTEPDRVT